MLKSTQFYGNIVQKIILKSVVINQNAQNVTYVNRRLRLYCREIAIRVFLAEKERSVVALQQTSLLLRGFWRKRDSPYSENGRVYSHSGACNGEFGGAAACNHILIAQNLSFDGKKPD